MTDGLEESRSAAAGDGAGADGGVGVQRRVPGENAVAAAVRHAAGAEGGRAAVQAEWGSAGRLWAAHRSGTEGHQRRTHPKDWCEVEQVSKGLVLSFNYIYTHLWEAKVINYHVILLTDSVGSLYIHIFNVNCMNYGPVKHAVGLLQKKEAIYYPSEKIVYLSVLFEIHVFHAKYTTNTFTYLCT